MPKKATTLLFLVSAVTVGGCVKYTPVELSAVAPSEEVRVRVTDAGALRLAQQLGRITDQVTASVAPRQPDSLAVTIWLGKDYPGTDFEDVRQTVVLPRAEVTDLRRRELDGWKTVALSAAAVAGTLVIANEIFQIGDPNNPGDNGDDPPPAVVTLRIPWGWIP